MSLYLVNGKTYISSVMARKLSVAQGRSPESWLLMQDNYNLWEARKEVDLGDFESFPLLHDFESRHMKGQLGMYSRNLEKKHQNQVKITFSHIL